MKRFVLAALMGLTLASCAGSHSAVKPPAASPTPPALERGDQVMPGLWVRTLAEGVWLFVAQNDPAAADPIDANGLVVRVGLQMILVDTGWNGAQVDALMEWFDRIESAPIRAAIVTHFHEDRAGGVMRCLERGLHVQMLDSTAARLELEDERLVHTFANIDTLPVSGRVLELDWPGAGHTRDNITVWIPDQKLLFGGCLLKAADWNTLGNVADADLALWPTSIRALQRRYPGAAIVVPGHGAVSDAGLLDHTLQLLEKRRR